MPELTFEERAVVTRESQTIHAPLVTLYVPKERQPGRQWRRAIHPATGVTVLADELRAGCVVIGAGGRYVKGREGDYLVRLPTGQRTILPRKRFESEYRWLAVAEPAAEGTQNGVIRLQ